MLPSCRRDGPIGSRDHENGYIAKKIRSVVIGVTKEGARPG